MTVSPAMFGKRFHGFSEIYLWLFEVVASTYVLGRGGGGQFQPKPFLLIYYNSAIASSRFLQATTEII